MTAEQLIKLHADKNRHFNALAIEMKSAPIAEMEALAYDENVTPDLAEAAYEEIERRQKAMKNLLAMNPSLGIGGALRAALNA